MKYAIHISDVKTFMDCRRKWDWASPLRRNLEPAVPYMPFFTGRAVHHCLEMYYQDGTPFLKSLDHYLQHERSLWGSLWPQEEVAVIDQIDLILGMLNHYQLWIKSSANKESRWRDDNLEFIALETTFEVPIRAPSGRSSTKVFLEGRMDGVVRMYDDGTYWVWEVKTARSIKELQGSLANELQAGAYMYAAKELFDVEPSGVLYNIIRKKSPQAVPVLKNGLLSQNKGMDVTVDSYLAEVRRNHPGWKKDTIKEVYGDMLAYLVEQPNAYFARTPVYRSQAEIDQLVSDLHLVSLEMTRPGVHIYPTPSWSCSWCHFRAPCLALNRGANVDFLMSVEYTQRKSAQSWREIEKEL